MKGFGHTILRARIQQRAQAQQAFEDAPERIVEHVPDSWRSDKRPKAVVKKEETGLIVEPKKPRGRTPPEPKPRPTIHKEYARRKNVGFMMSTYEADALYAYCAAHSVTVSTLCREATLKYIGYRPPRESLAKRRG